MLKYENDVLVSRLPWELDARTDEAVIRDYFDDVANEIHVLNQGGPRTCLFLLTQ